MQEISNNMIALALDRITPFSEQNEQFQYFAFDLKWRSHVTQLTPGDLCRKYDIRNVCL